MKSDRFRRAVEAGELDRIRELFTESVRFRSPFVFKPYDGLDAVEFLLRNVAEVFADFRYLRQVETGDCAVLVFEARAGDRELQGVDILVFDDDGLIEEMTVMVRPMTGLQALGEEMGARIAAAGD